MVYDNLTPWPTAADGTGASLQRVGRKAYGNAALSWRTAAPTPGSFVFDEVLPGDFNADGRHDVQDLDHLAAALRQHSPDPRFDLNGDGTFDAADRDVMVFDLLGSTYGDADLNGLFDSGDLIQVFGFGEYEDLVPFNSTWRTGDFNGDGEFDRSDLVSALAGGGYVSNALPTRATAMGWAMAKQPSVVSTEADRNPSDASATIRQREARLRRCLTQTWWPRQVQHRCSPTRTMITSPHSLPRMTWMTTGWILSSRVAQ